MAKAKDLAALAALAGLAYVNRDKLFGGKDKDKDKDKDKSKSSGMTPEQNDELATANRIRKMSDDSDTLARVNREEASGLPKIKNDVVNALTAPKAAPNDKAPNQGVVPPKSSGKSAAAKMTDNQNVVLADVGKKSKATAENDALANAGSKIPAATSMPVKPKPQLAKPGTGVGANIATIANPVTQDDIEFRRLRDARMAKKIGERNTSINAFKDAPMEDQIRQNMNSAGMKRGGMTKMASGGMTASRRGDGIASRGKTRGKIC